MSTLAALMPQFVVLIALIGSGVAMRKKQWVDDAFDAKLTKIILFISCPCLLISAVLETEDLPGPQELLWYLLLAWVAYLVLLVIAVVIAHFLAPEENQRGSYVFMIVFGNVVFFGLPISTALFGSVAAVYIAIISVPFNILCFTVGAYLIAREGEDAEAFRQRGVGSIVRGLITPINVASILCMALAFFGAHDTGVIQHTLDTVGSLTLPAALLIIGSSLAKFPLREVVGSWRVYVAVLLRLVVVPVAVFFVVRLFVTDATFLGTLMLVFAMPVATNGTLLCIQYKSDLHAITSGTFISNIAELVTIPVLCLALL